MDQDHHRKIELQSRGDLAFLYDNTRAVADEKLQAHFPRSTRDPFKQRVGAVLNDFVARTFVNAVPSISVNGLDIDTTPDTTTTTNADSSAANTQIDRETDPAAAIIALTSAPDTVEYEPYDSRLAGRVTSLHAKLEALTTEVATLRRETPGAAAEGYADVLRQEIEADDREYDGEEDGDGGDGDVVKIEVPERSAAEKERWRDGEMAEVYRESLKRLVMLQGDDDDDDNEDGDTDGEDRTLSKTIGKAERARKAVDVALKT